MAINALKKNNIEVVEIDISEFFIELITASVAGFLKNETFESILKGEVPIHEPLFNAFDGFKLAFKVPRILLKKMEHSKGHLREGIFIKALNLHLEENANFVDSRIKKCF